MNSLQDVWRIRFLYYVNELQKYLKYVFSGHLVIVFVFVLGAGGYQYSEWLKIAPSDFPAIWLVSGILGLLLAYSPPTTLIREPDQVYLLPLESSLMGYMKKALNWTFWSQIFIVLLPFLVSIPLLSQVGRVEPVTLAMVFISMFLLKYWNVRVEFAFRWANEGHGVWGDRVIRALISVLFLLAVFTMIPLYFALLMLPIIFYYYVWVKQLKGQPFPYEHFVKLEQNRMLRFYRFANYFTDVPHISGSIRRRVWLDWVYRVVPYGRASSQEFLLFRTFIRTDDTFYLWLRLTGIATIGAIFIGIPFVVMIFVGALAFASALQLKQALSSSNEFRMDMLFPIGEKARGLAVNKVVRIVQVVQAIIVAIAILLNGPESILLYAAPVIAIVISELTIRLSK
jgi:ABC-2 type transport system permease protein